MRKLRDEIHAYYDSLPPCPQCGERRHIGVIRPRLAGPDVRIECGSCGAFLCPFPEEILDIEVVEFDANATRPLAGKRWIRGETEGPCVYLLRRVEMYRRTESLWKIGSTNNLSRRAREFGEPMAVIASLPCSTLTEARQLERYIHERMRWPRIGREWYSFEVPA